MNKKFVAAIKDARETQAALLEKADWQLQIAREISNAEAGKVLQLAIQVRNFDKIINEALSFEYENAAKRQEVRTLGSTLSAAQKNLLLLNRQKIQVNIDVANLRRSARTAAMPNGLNRNDTSGQSRAERMLRDAESLESEYKQNLDTAQRLVDESLASLSQAVNSIRKEQDAVTMAQLEIKKNEKKAAEERRLELGRALEQARVNEQNGNYEKALEIYEQYSQQESILSLLPKYAKQMEEKHNFTGAKLAYERLNDRLSIERISDIANNQSLDYGRVDRLISDERYEEAGEIIRKYSDETKLRQIEFHKKVKEVQTRSLVAIIAGKASFFIDANGFLWSHGDEPFSGSRGTGKTYSTGEFIRKVGNENNWRSVWAHGLYAIALKTDGTLWSWGFNGRGQLGDGTYENRAEPVQIGRDKDWKVVAPCITSVFAVKNDGSLWAWGLIPFKDESKNEKGVNTPLQIVPGNDWKMATSDGEVVMAMKKNGTLLVWGKLSNSEQWIDPKSAHVVGKEQDWAFISDIGQIGSKLSAIKRDGSIWELDLSKNGGSYRGEVKRVPRNGEWVQSFEGSDFWIGLQADGSLWTCGKNSGGALGNGSREDSNIPVRVEGPKWKYFSCDFDIGEALRSLDSKSYHHYYEVFAIGEDDSIWAWGDGKIFQPLRTTAIETLLHLKTGADSVDSNLDKTYKNTKKEKDSSEVQSFEEKEFFKMKPWFEAQTQKYGHRPDTEEGYFDTKKEAEAGIVAAQFFQGLRLCEISDHGKDRIAATLGMQWLEKAALQGHMLSAQYIGLAHLNGLNGERNINAGVYWLRKAALAGSETAKMELAKYESSASRTDRDSETENLRPLIRRGLSKETAIRAAAIIEKHGFSIDEAMKEMDSGERNRMFGARTANQVLADPASLDNVMRTLALARSVFK
ncbi:MAG: hypothetical protein WCO60_07055 [Verrucomicrobiota bacterium]